jgi:TatD DNase family protein
VFIDTHSHLNFKEFDQDFEAVIERASLAGVNRMIVVGSDIKNSKKAIELANKNHHLFASVGIHPIHIRGSFGMRKDDGLPPSIWTEDYGVESSTEKTTVSSYELRKLLRSPRVVAMGEVGLDYHVEKGRNINKGVQRSALFGLVEMAEKENKPIIFHCREAIEDFFDTLKPKKDHFRGVIHCFQGDTIDARRAFDLGLLISYTGLITFRRDYDEIIKYAPMEKMMIETDCPFLTPEPYRGERNEPAYVVEVARRIAEIKDIPFFKVAEETTKNAVKLFGLDKF